MADFCSECSPFKDEQNWDIDLFRLAIGLDNGHSESFVCEGCNNRGVYKDENGKIYLAKQEANGIKLAEVRIEDLMT